MRRSGCYAAMVGLLAGTVFTGELLAQAAPAPGRESPQTQAAQGEGRRGQFAGMGRAAGEITAVNGGTLSIKAEDGSSMQIVTTDNTRLMKDRGPVKTSDLHVGDGVMAFGNLDAGTKTLHAAMVMATDAAQVKAMRENLGKTYITGRVTAVDLDNAKMTVERQDHVSQTIGFDESTSFKRAVRGGAAGGAEGGGGAPRGQGAGGSFGTGGMGMGAMAGAGMDRAFERGESITLADIKAGDYVMGTGVVKSGVFVPARLLDSPPGQRRQRDGAAPGAGAPAQPAQPGPGGR